MVAPPFKLVEVAVVGVSHGSAEIITGHRLAVVSLEIQVHAFTETVNAKQGLIHPDDLGTLVVHRTGVEVVHRHVGLRANRVRCRAGILSKLVRTENAHIVDALHGMAGVVGGELLIAEDREALFQGQLEPVAAGNPIACPVVKIFVCDHAGDGVVIAIGSGLLEWPAHTSN